MRDCRCSNDPVGGIGVQEVLRLSKHGDLRRDRKNPYLTRMDNVFQKLLGVSGEREPAFRNEHADFPQADVAASKRLAFEQSLGAARKARRRERIVDQNVRIKKVHASRAPPLPSGRDDVAHSRRFPQRLEPGARRLDWIFGRKQTGNNPAA